MAKGKYEYWLTAEGLLQLGRWARNGLTDEQIACNMGICRDTLNEWKKKYSVISDTLKKNKEIVDTQVENALLQKALGINKTIKKPIKVKEVKYDCGKRISEKEHIEYADEEIYIPPDTTAQIFWLKNRKPEDWRDKKDVSVEGNINSVVFTMSDEELNERIESLKGKLGICDE